MEEINVGDLITSYHSGYHIVTRITFGNSGELLSIYYMQVIRANGKLRKSKAPELSCSHVFCKKVDQAFINARMQETIDLCDNIRKFI